ncbi:MAG: AbrB/MazE/SpoVT family DNA-binding domain-containing protein [Acidobacteria bacterium]|nr:AbrB/MazE/SpoVT family DNA-binding domain-containing protein [Acidobacteriota bacterium]
MQTSKLSSKSQVTLPKEVRAALRAKPGDVIAYEIEDNVVYLKRVEPFDAAFHKALTHTLNEWASAEDEEAFRDL